MRIISIILVVFLASCITQRPHNIYYNHNVVKVMEIVANVLGLEHKNIKDADVRIQTLYSRDASSLVQLDNKILYTRITFPCRNYKYSHVIITQFTLYNTISINDEWWSNSILDDKIIKEVQDIICQ